MQQMPDPAGGQGPPRRVLRPGTQSVRVPDAGDEVDLHAIMAAQQAALTTHLEEGLEAIQRSTERLVRKIAAEVWKATTAKGAAPMNDDAARGILAYVDERYQQLKLGMGKVDDTMGKLARATGEVVLRLNQSGETVDRTARLAEEQAKRQHAALSQLAVRIERSLQPVTARLDAIEKSLQAATARQRAELTAFTERTGEGLSRVGKRLREGFSQLQQQTAEENTGLVERIQAAVSREIERVERLADEQAAAGAAIAERIARSVRDVTERTTTAVADLRGSVDERIESVTRDTNEALAETSAQLAARQRAMIDAALRTLERRADLHVVPQETEATAAWTGAETEEWSMTSPEPPPTAPEPAAIEPMEMEQPSVPFDPGIDDLQSSIDSLLDLGFDDED